MKIKQLLEDRRNEIRERFGVKSICVFGSYAKDTQSKDSDVDVLVEFHEANFDNSMDRLFYLQDLFGRKVDLVSTGGLSPHIGPRITEEVVWCE